MKAADSRRLRVKKKKKKKANAAWQGASCFGGSTAAVRTHRVVKWEKEEKEKAPRPAHNRRTRDRIAKEVGRGAF